MFEPKDQLDQRKSKFTKAGLIIILFTILVGAGLVAYLINVSSTPRLGKDCDRAYIMNVEFNKDVGEAQAMSIIKSHKADLWSLGLSSFTETLVAALCVKNGQDYLDGKKQNPLMAAFEKDEGVQRVWIEELYSPF